MVVEPIWWVNITVGNS